MAFHGNGLFAINGPVELEKYFGGISVICCFATNIPNVETFYFGGKAMKWPLCHQGPSEMKSFYWWQTDEKRFHRQELISRRKKPWCHLAETTILPPI